MTAKPDIVLLAPWLAPAMAELDRLFTVHKFWQASDSDAFLARVREQCVGIAGGALCDASLMDALPRTRVIAVPTVGYDDVDIDAATARGIKVSNTPDVLSDEVADFTIGLTLATLRRIPQGDRYVRESRWEREGNMPLNQRMWGRKVGILGMGRIGSEIARRFAAFRMEILYHSREPKDLPYRYIDSLIGLAREVDILVVIVPGGKTTRHLVNRDVLDALGSEGTLINVARGSVVDEDALIAALESGSLGSAGLDVFENEPAVPEKLKAMTDNVVLQPHQASATHETRIAMARLAIKNLVAGIEGRKLLTPVN